MDMTLLGLDPIPVGELLELEEQPPSRCAVCEEGSAQSVRPGVDQGRVARSALGSGDLLEAPDELGTGPDVHRLLFHRDSV